MNLSRSTYYARPDSGRRKIVQITDAELRAAIEEIVAEWPAYCYRRVTHKLRRRGIHVNHKRVARVMREAALSPRRIRQFLVTTDSEHSEPVFPSLRGYGCRDRINFGSQT